MRIVVKAGSALISDGHQLRREWMLEKVREIVELVRSGHQVILVSSGAVAAGMEIQGIAERPTRTLELQLLSGIGQARMMKQYLDFFRIYGLAVAQILLTHHNFASPREVGSIVDVVELCLSNDVVPVVNENDMVNKEEFEGVGRAFTDNDVLASLVAVHLKADTLVLLTDVDGLYRGNPRHNAPGIPPEFIPEITGSPAEFSSHASGGGTLGSGGMASKLAAAETAFQAGISAIIGNGNRSIRDLLSGTAPATRVLPRAG